VLVAIAKAAAPRVSVTCQASESRTRSWLTAHHLPWGLDSRARDARACWVCQAGIAFLHQAVRYRGKANYRDAIYLA
jgi:hypothetical protein